jgi:hypothetical protein
LFDRALLVARRLVELKRRAKLARIPVEYLNDNFGRWQSNRPQALIERYNFQDQLRAPHEASTSWDRV